MEWIRVNNKKAKLEVNGYIVFIEPVPESVVYNSLNN